VIIVLVNTYKQQLHIVHKSSNNVWHLICGTLHYRTFSTLLTHTVYSVLILTVVSGRQDKPKIHYALQAEPSSAPIWTVLSAHMERLQCNTAKGEQSIAGHVVSSLLQTTVIFYVLLTVHLGSVLVNNQHEAQFYFRIYLFKFSTCFIRRINCITTTFGICHSM
jgi:hypothetical protein